jgi:hypothetical protein
MSRVSMPIPGCRPRPPLVTFACSHGRQPAHTRVKRGFARHLFGVERDRIKVIPAAAQSAGDEPRPEVQHVSGAIDASANST